jgi:hypothetical protein
MKGIKCSKVFKKCQEFQEVSRVIKRYQEVSRLLRDKKGITSIVQQLPRVSKVYMAYTVSMNW